MQYGRAFRVVAGAILLGAVVGTVLSELARAFVPDGPVKSLLTASASFGFSPFTLDAVLFQLTLGLAFSFTLLHVFFIVLFLWVLYRL